MNSQDDEKRDPNAAGEKGQRVRETISKALSSEQVGVEPEIEDGGAPVSHREPVGTGDASDPAVAAAQKRLAEIEARVGELVKDPELENEGKARSGS